MPSLSIAVTGGGTKTTAAIIADGVLVDGWTFPYPSNPARIGVAAAVDHLVAAVAEARDLFHLEKAPDAFAFGVAGVGDPVRFAALEDALEGRLGRRVFLCTDAEASLAATAPEGLAVVLIAGTGAIAFGRGDNGDVRRVGGENPEGGDPGSGTAIDLRARAGGAPENLQAALETLASDVPGNGAALVGDFAERGCAFSRDLLDTAAGELVDLAVRVVHDIECDPLGAIRVGIVGGVLEGSRFLRDRVESELRNRFPGLLFGPPANAPEMGAYWLSRGLARA